MRQSKYARIRRSDGYRSGFEHSTAKHLQMLGVDFQYEPFTITFTQPAKVRRYLPDFLLPNGILIETKGEFTPADRQKHLWIKEQHPEYDIRFVFANPYRTISKESSTTYAKWCQQYGFKWACGTIPEEWLKEPKKKRKGLK